VKTAAVDKAEMVYVPPDTYTWGVHQKQLPGFWIDKYEVTNENFKEFLDAGGYSNPAYWSPTGWEWRQSQGITQPLFWDDSRYNAPQQPVVGISWYEADAYARWAGRRLPTTLEWQAAAQGTDNRIWPWGNTWAAQKANMADGSRGAPVAVGSYPDGASPFGALDMAGNVWEYTADWYMLRAGSNDHTYCATLSSSWDTGFDQDRFCSERRSHTFGRYASGGFRTARSDEP
jgi:formylglycine-generating enzyme required for sulfatase activity